MEVKSISDCLNLIDNMIFQKNFKIMVKNDLERIRNLIEWQQADCVDCLPVLRQINRIIERSYSDDKEKELDEQYYKLRQRILELYDTINAKAGNKNQE